MADNEREWRINEREYEKVTDEQLVKILDDTGRDCPSNHTYNPATVYSMARSLRANRQLLEAIAAPGSPAPAEVKAKLFRELMKQKEDGKPEGTRESLARCVSMLDTWGPECFPASKDGQVDFARAMMESVADEIRAFLAHPTQGS